MQYKTLGHIDEILNAIHFGDHWALCGSLVPNSFQLTEDKTKVNCPYCLGLLDKQ
jgi:hypothetical protein